MLVRTLKAGQEFSYGGIIVKMIDARSGRAKIGFTTPDGETVIADIEDPEIGAEEAESDAESEGTPADAQACAA